MRGTKDHQEFMIEQLRKDPEFRAEYVNQALEENEQGVRLTMLRNVASATVGFTKLAKASGIQRQSLYKALSANGNPEFESFKKILFVLGYRLQAVKVSRMKRHAVRA